MAKNKGKGKESIDIEDINIEDEAPKGKKDGGKKAKAEPAPEKGKAKGAAAKAEKGKQPEHLKREPLPEGFITAEQLAEEFGKKGRDVRQVLRDNEIEKPESGRWAWHEKKDKDMLKRIRGLLSGGGSKAKEKAEEAPKGKSKKGNEAPAATEAPKKKKK